MRHRGIVLGSLSSYVLAFAFRSDVVTGLLSSERFKARPRRLLPPTEVSSRQRNRNAQQAKKQKNTQKILEEFGDSDNSDSFSSDVFAMDASFDSEEENSEYQHPQAFPRNEKWLEEATSEILDHDVYPIGDLVAEDVESISGLMAAWARRGSVNAALNVERLLKRIVDDINAGNVDVKVSTRQYTYVSFFCELYI